MTQDARKVKEITGRLGRHLEHIIPGGDCFRRSTLKLYTIDFMTIGTKELETAK